MNINYITIRYIVVDYINTISNMTILIVTKCKYIIIKALTSELICCII